LLIRPTTAEREKSRYGETDGLVQERKLDREKKRGAKGLKARKKERERRGGGGGKGEEDAADGSDVSGCSQTLRGYAKKGEDCARFQCPIRSSI